MAEDLHQSAARVVVIGGGVVGCSVLYHLALSGWQDIILLERQELTSGSSWHAAGSLFALTTPFNASVLQKYTLELLPRLEKQSGQNCGFHQTGELWLAESTEQLKAMQVIRAQGQRNGIEAEFISMSEAQKIAPILNTDGLKEVMFEPDAGHCDPASVTHAFAKAARMLGAKIFRHTPVIETNLLPSGEWQVVSENGTINAEYVVNAAGLWGREVAALAGIHLPMMPVEHHYLVTETIPQIAQMTTKLPSIAMNEVNVYSRQEADGLLLGAYEGSCHLWSENGTPKDFGHELLPNKLERMEENFLHAVERMPCLAEAGIKNIINGPMIFSPDLEPLIGPHPKLRNYFCANAVMTGFNQASGIGKVLADWIIENDPGMDMTFWHVGRFGDYADPDYTKPRVKYFYEHRSTLIYPYQDFDAGRPVRKRPIYEQQKKAGAVFAEYAGWEDPVYYARNRDEQLPRYAFEQGSWVDAVAAEVSAVHGRVGLFDYSSFAKYRIRGEGVKPWLSYLLAGRVPDRAGKTALCPMLNHNGCLIGDLTLSCLNENHYMLIGSGSMQDIHVGWFHQHLPKSGVEIENLSDSYCALHIAGPHAAQLLARVSGEDTSFGSFAFLTCKPLTIAQCDRVFVIRVSFTGESGFELYLPQENLLAVYQALIEQGGQFGLKQVGSHALMSMRLEKSFPSWGLELTSDYHPWQCGLGRFVDLGKRDFIGCNAALALAANPVDEQLVTIEINANDRQAFGGEPVFSDNRFIGYVTSGGRGYRTGKNLALAYLNNINRQSDRQNLEIEMIGRRFEASLIADSPFDPENSVMRQ